MARTIGWLTSCCIHGRVSLRTMSEAALIECQLMTKAKSFGITDQLATIAKLKGTETKCFDLLATYWRLILWPVSALVSDQAQKRSLITPAGQLPDNLVGIMSGEIKHLAEIAGVSMETAWNAGATDGSDERRLISVWLCRHTKAQLQKLRSELNVTEGSETMGREELAGCVLNAHRPGRPLTLPKRLRGAR